MLSRIVTLDFLIYRLTELTECINLMIDQASPTTQHAVHPELPQPSETEQIHSELLSNHIRQEMRRAGGRLGFDRFMDLSLYAPGLGYYVAAMRKFGADGDFITAPEISSLFSRCLARQCMQVFAQLGGGDLLEFGAGTGVMAADILAELQGLNCLPERYLILELSPDLRQRQRETLHRLVPELVHLVHWLDAMPAPGFQGVVLANEVLDAMPVQRFRVERDGIKEQFVYYRDGGFRSAWDLPVTPGLEQAVEAMDLAVGYESEMNLRTVSWVEQLGELLNRGAVLLIDYGYPRSEYYHPQRSTGTLMCHYRHRAHADPLVLLGLQDITAHVDFTAIAEAGIHAGFEVAGFSTQAYFLMGCGLDSLMAASDPDDVERHMRLVQEIRRLTLPTEMGERFKVLGLTRGVEQPLMGFAMRDQRERL